MTGSSDDEQLGFLPSFDLVRTELDIQQADVERRASSLDSKAGIILSAAGIVVALKPYSTNAVNVSGTAAAAIAGAFAVWSFAPRTVAVTVERVAASWIAPARSLATQP